ncbi:MAG: 3'-5' exonuclease [Oceanospirillaceae bacterium]|nr:3'-5' exonuclease [Oceanospirillaceae bacterium]
MLDKSALSQLQTLKQEIHDSIPRFEGKVRATTGRFGFVVTEDNKQFYLSPDEMEKVLPGDAIAFRVDQVDDKKEQAVIESLISTEISQFCGRYIVKGKGHFIEADHPALNRWIFVPPKLRKSAKEGMLVKAHISQHPYPNGRAQAEIDHCIGMPDEAGVEALFMCHKWNIETKFPDDITSQVEAINSQPLDSGNRVDLTELPFVTIDSASTRDLDDALYAEASEDGWTLHIAIADPTSVIAEDSPLNDLARSRATSVYFSNMMLPMLPAEISEQMCSLQADEVRLALVITLSVSASGEITSTQLQQAQVKSQGKLSYQAVSQLLESGESDEIPALLHAPLMQLNQCAVALSEERARNHIVMDERPDYRLVLNDSGKVEGINRIERNQAQRLVEECMLACNRSVANWLAEQEAGFFVVHKGFRTERIGDITSLVREQAKLDHKPKIKELTDFVTLVKQAEQADSSLAMKAILSRQMDRSYLSAEALPHMGLGFPHYTTVTSPLRKYNDFLLHRVIGALLQQQTAPGIEEGTLQSIQEKQAHARTAASQAEFWMKLDWLAQQGEEQSYDAVIAHATAQQITVRLEEFGIDGHIDRRKVKGKWTFDSKSMSHVKGDQRFDIGQTIKVKIQSVDSATRQLRFIIV